MIIHLPYPPKVLSPNSRVHWAQKARVAKMYRAECRLLTRQAFGAKGSPRFDEGEIAISITFTPPDRRARDDDNLIASFKSGRDGVADALGINDCRFVTTTRVSRDPVKGGSVQVEISEGK